MELSMMVKGITANSVTVQPASATTTSSSSTLTASRFHRSWPARASASRRSARDSIAEFQIRHEFVRHHAGPLRWHSGAAIFEIRHNTPAGSLYGFFRSDAFNAADPVSHTVLPFSDHRWAAARRSHRPEQDPLLRLVRITSGSSTIFLDPRRLRRTGVPLPTIRRSEASAKLDDVLSPKDQLSLRGSRWDSNNPFSLGGNGYPSPVRALPVRHERPGNGRVSSTRTSCSSCDVGYDDFLFRPDRAASVAGAADSISPGSPWRAVEPASIECSARSTALRLKLAQDKHDMKIGGRGTCTSRHRLLGLLENGRFTMSSIPVEPGHADPAERGVQSGDVEPVGAEFIRELLQPELNQSGWKIDVPRPEWRCGSGDTWKLKKSGVNYGLRWDDDFGVFSPPNVPETTINIQQRHADPGLRLQGQHPRPSRLRQRGGFAVRRSIRHSSSAAGAACTTARRTRTCS